MYLCVRVIVFASFYDFSIGLCGIFLFLNLLLNNVVIINTKVHRPQGNLTQL